MVKLLIADDNDTLRRAIEKAFRRIGFETVAVSNGEEAVAAVEKQVFDLALLDIKMPGVDGLATLKRIKEIHPETRVILMTGHASVETAVEALRQEAADYLLKPFTIVELENKMIQILEKFNLLHPSPSQKSENTTDTLLGSSQAIKDLKNQIFELAKMEAPLMISGEPGTGRKLAARCIHQFSNRKDKPFISIHCQTLPPALLQAEIFGEEKPSDTGATVKKRGVLELNQQGTVLIDQLDHLDATLQKKLSASMAHCKAHIIATVGPEKKLSKKLGGQFPTTISIPPLRERLEDLPLLIQHFLEKYQRILNKKISLSKGALIALKKYPWPGNIRELENVIERATVLTPANQEIGLEEFPVRILKANAS